MQKMASKDLPTTTNAPASDLHQLQSPIPYQKATVKELATDPVTIGIRSPIEPQITQRIRKCFAMAASSAGTTEAEGKMALRMACKCLSIT
jgi:hypothetical protein